MYSTFADFVLQYRNASAISPGTFTYAIAVAMLVSMAAVVSWVVSIRSYSHHLFRRYAVALAGVAAVVWIGVVWSMLYAWSWDIPVEEHGRLLLSYGSKALGVDETRTAAAFLDYANAVGPLAAEVRRLATPEWLMPVTWTAVAAMFAAGLFLLSSRDSELAVGGGILVCVVAAGTMTGCFLGFETLPASIVDDFEWFVRVNGRAALELAPVLPGR